MIELNWKTVRFIVVGVLAALVYFFCSYLFLSYTELPAFLASLFAYVCSFGFAYLGQKIWAFRSIAPHSVTLFRYAVLQACCATFAATFTQVFVSYTDLSPLLLSGLATVFISGFSYIVSSCWVFADSDDYTAQFSTIENSEYQTATPGYKDWHIGLWVFVWLLLSITYIIIFYYMPWGINLDAQYDDNVFVSQAYSLAAGDWLGAYSQFTLMKGPGYSLFLVLVHILGVPVYLLTALFHTLATSFFAWCIYRLSQSRLLASILFSTLLFLPITIASDRIIRDQIYPEQLLMGLAALIFSLFIADTSVKRVSAAILAGIMFAWLWLTREEGIWILPSIVLLLLYAIYQFWRQKKLQQGLLSSVLVVVLSFSAVHITFRLINWSVYGSFVGLDIKEKNFKAAISALQSVRVGERISHVPVSQETMRAVYRVSPSFAELKHYFDSPGRRWRDPGCPLYPWACDELAGGWFIWALRGAADYQGYYQTPAKAADFFARVESEINQACDAGRLICKTSLLSYMPAVAERDIDKIPETLIQLRKMLLLSEGSAEKLRSRSGISGKLSDKLTLLDFLNSRDRFTLHEVTVTIFGKFANIDGSSHKIDISITDNQGEIFPYIIKLKSHNPDADGYYRFSLQTGCSGNCRLIVSADTEQLLASIIPDTSQDIKQHQPIAMGRIQVVFDKVQWGKGITGKLGAEEQRTYKVRQGLFIIFQAVLPLLLALGLVSFSVLTVLAVKQRDYSVLYVLTVSVWLAVLARLTILFLVEISSFPALKLLYFKPVYSLVLIASMINIYLLIQLYRNAGLIKTETQKGLSYRRFLLILNHEEHEG